MKVRTRIAPSPTGKDVHVGSLATALMNFAWAKKNNGQFIIRIEDTDRSRLVEGGEAKMLQTFADLGLVADESPLVGGRYAPYRQSERLEIYKKHADELIAKGKAYYCVCTPERLDEMRKAQQAKKEIPKYDRKCYHDQENVKKLVASGAKHVIRMLMPEEEIAFDDIVRGRVVMHGSNLDDQVILKSDGFPTYHLGVVVDDHLMDITHVLRGEEWLPSTPKHIVLFRSFGWELPLFGHLSVLRNPDKSKLSKRKNPVWASEYVAKGILKEALLNYLALMGWSHPEEKEIFDLDEYIRVFDIKDIQTTAPVFDPVKLEWMNGEYLRKVPSSKFQVLIEEYLEKYQPENYEVIVNNKEKFEKSIPLVQERLKKLSEYFSLCEFYYQAPTTYEVDLVEYKDLISKTTSELTKIENWTAQNIGDAMGRVCEETGASRSKYFMAMRVAITGKKISPPLNESMEILGKEESIERLKTTISNS
ncbi:MAG: glutamate--tRNA ligase [Patescibacteria group bacterium]